MSRFFNVIRHLLPTGRAWRMTVDKTLRQYFEGLASAGQDARDEVDRVASDLSPATTRELDKWEAQFALPNTGQTEAERRARLDATWKQLGGQDPRYIQDVLQAAGFDVYVHEWWEPIPGRPTGGSINNDVTPVPRDPTAVLGGESRFAVLDGEPNTQDGSATAQDGATDGTPGYPLVNKIIIAEQTTTGDGSVAMLDGGLLAQDGGNVTVFKRKEYIVPTDPALWPYFLYIGGEVFPASATVPLARREEFEDLCLKICPTEQWLGILVSYN